MVPNIKTIRLWDMESVRNACIRNNLYTGGNCEEYSNLLNCVESSYPDTENIYLIAKDIMEHSKGQTVSNIMFILENEAVTTLYEVEGEEE